MYQMKDKINEDIKENGKMKPPYATSGQADAILDIFRRVTPKKIDSKFVSDNGIATPTNAFRSVDLLKWLHIIDSNGEVIDEAARKLRMVGEERDRFVAEQIKISYKDLFERINLKEANKNDVTNFFISEYGYGGSQALHASRLFLHLCHRFGLEVSENLKKQTWGSQPINRMKKRKLKIKPSIKREETNENEGKVMITVEGNGIRKKYVVENGEDLQNLYDGELKNAISAAKILFPIKKEISEE